MGSEKTLCGICLVLIQSFDQIFFIVPKTFPRSDSHFNLCYRHRMAFSSLPGWTMGGFLPLTLSRELASGITYPTKFTNEDEKWMFVALIEGMKGCGISNPNPSVGCVIVKNGKQISSGATEAYKKRHAERVAIDALPAGTDLSQATAYITLEPCSHQGQQPPCVDLLLEKKIGRVVIASTDPNPKVDGAGIKQLREAGIPVTLGVLQKEANLWHFPFRAYHRLKRPILIGKWAQTPNGLLAGDDGKQVWITGPTSRAYGHWLRQKYDAVVVGAGTYLKDKPSLTVRDCRTPILRQPMRVIIDPKGRIKDSEGIHVLRPRFEDLVEEVQKWFQGKQVQSVFVEGGPTLLRLFLEKKAFDALHIFTGKTALMGSRYALSFNKFAASYQKVSEAVIQEDTLEEYLLPSILNGS